MTVSKRLTGEIFPLVSGELEETEQSTSVVQFVAGLPEDESELLVVVGHQLRLRRFL